jgi:hypothetical protein
MVFRIELSQPAEQTVVLIYGTVEGTAKAGKDFEPQQGMVTLAPGIRSAEVRVPLIEQPSSEGEKSFKLFLAADPKVAEVVDKRVVATINGAIDAPVASSSGAGPDGPPTPSAEAPAVGATPEPDAPIEELGGPRGPLETTASWTKADPAADEETAALLLVSRQTLDGLTPEWQSRPRPYASAGRSQVQVGGTPSARRYPVKGRYNPLHCRRRRQPARRGMARQPSPTWAARFPAWRIARRCQRVGSESSSITSRTIMELRSWQSD